ncbi:MAG TPA: hypothetical protein VL992_05355 [Tepidisphaeraceae bacterium]|nr:hypothetical protein [Tepidisphaeraceae bacterium]
MKRTLLIVVFVLVSFNGIALPQTAQNGDIQSFDLTPSPPSTKYWLLTDPRQALDGNSAFLYADAAATLNDAINKQTADALDAYWSNNGNFDSLAAAVEKARVYYTVQSTFDLLAIAARRQDYHWESSWRQQGGETLIPHILGERKLIDLISVRALEQIRAGQFDNAVDTIRLGYEMGRKAGSEQLMICGLVGSAIVSRSAALTEDLMKQPNAPNLYWALASLPRSMVSFQNCLAGETGDVRATIHELDTDRPQDISVETWHTIFDKCVGFLKHSVDVPNHGWDNPQTVSEEIARMAPQAADDYAQRFGLSRDQVNSLDPFKVVLTYWYCQNQQLEEQMYQLASLPYPLLLKQAADFDRRAKRMALDEPANPFLEWIASIDKAARRFARADRLMAAMTDVEAIRSYAATNGGKLPEHLQDITATPALDNPRTGRPFDYRVDGDAATLSDPEPAENPLTFTIRIRQ